MNIQEIQIDALARAQRGAEFLDRVCPGWESKIDLGTLNMSSSTDCVLGQLAGDYWTVRTELGISFNYAIHLGFDQLIGLNSSDSRLTRSQALTGAWREIILTRRQQAQDAAYATYVQNINWAPVELVEQTEEPDQAFLDRFWAIVERV